jgi:hypothetical protein
MLFGPRVSFLKICEELYTHYQGPWEHEAPPWKPGEKTYPAPTKIVKRTRKERDWEELGIPPGPGRCYWKAKIADFEGLPAIPASNVLVWGANGAGKTHLAAALAKLRSARWTTGDAISHMEPTRFPPEWYFSKHLVLDDLLRGKHTDVGHGALVSFIARRLDENNLTIVTCDKSPSDIAGVDPALASRLRGFATLRLKGTDKRKPKENK